MRKVCTTNPNLKVIFYLFKYTVWISLIMIVLFGIKFRTERCVTHLYFWENIFRFFFVKIIFFSKIFWSKILKFLQIFDEFIYFSWNHQNFDQNIVVKTMKITNFVKKIINFDVKKKFRLRRAEYLLKRRAGLRRPTASGLNCDQK